MILAPGRPDPPVSRLVAAAASAVAAPETLVLSSGSAGDRGALEALLTDRRHRPGVRVLVLSALGAHPDARARRLRALWELEERVRAAAVPALVLRLAPLLGPASPLWHRLRAGSPPGRHGELLLQPVVEADALETLMRALRETADWSGWLEIVGPEALTLAELAALAARHAPRLPPEAGAWEPELEEMAEQRLATDDPWRERFGMVPRRVTEEVVAWR